MPVLTMNKFFQGVVCAIFAVVLNGCGGPSVPPPSDADIKALAQKQVEVLVAAVQSNPNSSDASAAQLVESLQSYVSEYGNAFQPLLTEAEALAKLQASNAPKDQISEQAGKLESAAKAL